MASRTALLVLVGAAADLAPGTCSNGEPPVHARPKLLSWQPRAFLYEGFLTEEEVQAVTALAEDRLQPSRLQQTQVDLSTRSSDTVFLESWELRRAGSDIVEALRFRSAEEARLAPDHLEALQVTRYNVSTTSPGHYAPHPDTSTADPQTLDRIYGEPRRAATWIFYLSDGFDGGETVFPFATAVSCGHRWPPQELERHSARELVKLAAFQWPSAYCGMNASGLRVSPRRGDALLFYSLLPSGYFDPSAVHGGCPVQTSISSQNKLIAQQWLGEGPLDPFLSDQLLAAWPLQLGGSFGATFGPGPSLSVDPIDISQFCVPADFSDQLGAAVATMGAIAASFWLYLPQIPSSKCQVWNVLFQIGTLRLSVDACDEAGGKVSLSFGDKAWHSSTRGTRRGVWTHWMLLFRKVDDHIVESSFVREATTARQWTAAPEPAMSFASALALSRTCVMAPTEEVRLSEVWLWAGHPDQRQIVWLWSRSEMRRKQLSKEDEQA